MCHFIHRALAHAALLAIALSASAQAPTRAAQPDPLDARAAVPVAAYRSALAGYQRFGEAPPMAWRQANDTADSIGGWRAYAREAQGAAPVAPAAAHGAAASAPARPKRTTP